MIEFVKARDGQCRFPGCAISARFCDVDHVVPWPVGATDPTNLVCLCRRHHRIKQRPRWRARLDADGTLVWTDPTGHESTTLPLDHLQGEEVAAPPPVVATSRTELGSESELPAELGPSASELAGELPSVLEEAFEHLTEGVLVELACHPRTLTAHNRRALRTGQRIDISRIERVSTRGCSRVEIVRVRDRLDVDELLFRRHRHRHRSSSRRIRGLSSDDPPPF